MTLIRTCRSLIIVLQFREKVIGVVSGKAWFSSLADSCTYSGNLSLTCRADLSNINVSCQYLMITLLKCPTWWEYNPFSRRWISPQSTKNGILWMTVVSSHLGSFTTFKPSLPPRERQQLDKCRVCCLQLGAKTFIWEIRSWQLLLKWWKFVNYLAWKLDQRRYRAGHQGDSHERNCRERLKLGLDTLLCSPDCSSYFLAFRTTGNSSWKANKPQRDQSKTFWSSSRTKSSSGQEDGLRMEALHKNLFA